MSARLKLIVAYDGGQFAGWQSQRGGNTIQDRLEAAIACVSGGNVRLHGAGRTDAGVHALGQCAHVDVPAKTLTPERWRAALNAALPPAIRVVRCSYVAADFHARFSAVGRVYRYRICNAPVLSPFERGRAWHVPQQLDLSRLRAAVSLFEGTHDFAGFAANRGKPEANTTRAISSVRMNKRGDIVALEFAGDGFLYKMVRLLVGSAVRCAMGRLPVDAIRRRLESPLSKGERYAAPAHGLYLVRVRY